MSRATIRLAKDLEVPIDIVTQTMAEIGRKGAGKTYLATMIAEQMLDAEAQIVVIDPIGNWYGLRIGADGKSKGKSIFVIGGEHQDVPLVPEAGARIARLLVEKRVSAILDVSAFRLGERKRFAADFAEEFLHLKKSQKSPVHIFIEEAQLFIPQRVGPEEARMVGAWEQIVRLGRNYGIGASLITQRPQSVNKEVLSQVECLCVLQVNGIHERKALEEWIQESGADRALVGALPGLERGQGFVWSPSWLRLFKKVQFNKKMTFDASATPEVGKETKAGTLAEVDVQALLNDLTEVVKSAEADDPKALKRRIRELETRAVKATPAAPVDHARERALIDNAEANGFHEGMTHFAQTVKDIRKRIHIAQENLIGAVNDLDRVVHEQAKHQTAPRHAPIITKSHQAAPARLSPPSGLTVPTWNGSAPVTGVCQRILNALAELEQLGSRQPPRELVAILAGYSHPQSTGFVKALGSLRMGEDVSYPQPGTVVLTEAGRAKAKFPENPRTTEEVQQRIIQLLGGVSGRILTPLIAAYPEAMSRADVAAAAGYNHIQSTGFVKILGRLRSLGFVSYPNSGSVSASPILFLEGAAA